MYIYIIIGTTYLSRNKSHVKYLFTINLNFNYYDLLVEKYKNI